MATVAINGFETGTVPHPNWTNQTLTGVSAAAASGRDGIGISFTQTANLGTSFGFIFTSGSDTIYIHQGIKMASGIWGTTQALINIQADSGATTHLSITIDGTGHPVLRRGTGSGTVIQTSSTALPTTSLIWYSMEVKSTIHDSTGECIVKLNGVEYLNFTGDTKNAGTSTRPDTLSWPINNTAFSLDDVLINDTTGGANNTWTGEISVVGIRPSGNGANSVLVGSDGNSVNNYQQVDELPLNTSDYNGSATVTDLDTYDFTAVGKTGTVVAVQNLAYAAKSDAGTKSFKHVTRSSGGTLLKSSAIPLSTTYTVYAGPIWTTDADSSAWTVSLVDSAEFGFEVA